MPGAKQQAMLAGPNPLPPGDMAAEERLSEIAELLAFGLMRLRAAKSSPFMPRTGESSLDLAAKQSGHANPETERRDP